MIQMKILIGYKWQAFAAWRKLIPMKICRAVYRDPTSLQLLLTKLVCAYLLLSLIRVCLCILNCRFNLHFFMPTLMFNQNLPKAFLLKESFSFKKYLSDVRHKSIGFTEAYSRPYVNHLCQTSMMKSVAKFS